MLPLQLETSGLPPSGLYKGRETVHAGLGWILGGWEGLRSLGTRTQASCLLLMGWACEVPLIPIIHSFIHSFFSSANIH